VLTPVPAGGGAPGVQDAEGAWWRAFRFIEGAAPAGPVGNAEMARQVGQAFGRFSRWMLEYDADSLVEVLPRFHDTAARLEAFVAVAASDVSSRRNDVAPELEFVEARRRYAGILPPLIGTPELPRRVAHNDAKADNLLVDATTGASLAVVDLDTVMPGSLLADVGDLVRSTATGAAEDTTDPQERAVRPELVEAVLGGYLAEMAPRLTDTERRLMVFAGILLAYEQGVRFLTDHLAGDRYYRVTRPGHNLDRARAQFSLVASLEEHRSDLERAIARLP
jgi:Ser/Thr protein kinase RdoA (MazF antagonist)